MSHPLYAAPKPRTTTEVPHTAYQVDFVAVNCGKIVAASKRRIRFKFGYTDPEALASGKTGQDCRGAEHEVSVTWSLSSGKQAVAFDKHEVYFDVGDSTQTKISHAWKDEQGHVLEVKIHAANVSTKTNPDPDWKQYDLLIDGVSFFRMPKIYEIGVFAKEDAAGDAPRFAQYPPSQAGPRSMVPAEPKPEPVMDLLSFDDMDAPAPAPVAPAPQAAPVQAPVQAPAPTHYAPAQASFAQPPPQNYAPPAQAQAQMYQAPAQAPAQTYQAPDQAPAQNYHAPAQAPAQTYQAPQAPAQTYAQNQGNYNYVSPNSSPTGAGNMDATMVQDPAAFYSPPANADAAQANPVTPNGSSTALVPVQPTPTSYGIDKNLVNLDNLFGTPATATQESVHAKVEEANAHKSLGQLQGSNSQPKKPVMNTFNTAPAYQQPQQGYAQTQQYQQAQPQYNYGYQQQQAFSQPGFAHQ